jgi:hypothetical protein
MSEVVIASKHRQVVTDAQLCQQGIDRSDLHAAASAAIAQLRCPNVILSTGNQQGNGSKPGQYSIAGLWGREALKKLLQDKAGRENCLAAVVGLDQSPCLRRRRRIAPKGQRPRAGINEQAQSRLRSAL